MFTQNDYINRLIVEQNMMDRLKEAEIRRLLLQAQTHQRGWLSRQCRWLLFCLGQRLVAMGERMKQGYELTKGAENGAEKPSVA